MSNLRNLNQPGPFWDFISNLENRDWSNHPFAAAYAEAGAPNNDQHMEGEAEAEAGPSWGRGPWGFGRPHHGGRGRWGRGPPGGFEQPPPPPPAGAFDAESPSNDTEKTVPANEDEEQGPPQPEGPPFAQGQGRGPFGRRGGHGGRGRGGPHGCGGRRGRGGPFNMSNVAEFLQSQIFGEEGANAQNKAAGNGDFVPPVDIFDTETSFVIHVSLPGVKKEDVAVSWDAERSEVNITGVVHRPGDEQFLKTLALDERKVGAFARKVKLGTKMDPAQVDADGISAKLEEGILRVNVPKEEREFDVIHKIDID